MAIVQLVDKHTGETLFAYSLASNDPDESIVDALETVVEFALLRDAEVANWCRHELLGGCDVCDR